MLCQLMVNRFKSSLDKFLCYEYYDFCAEMQGNGSQSELSVDNS